MEEKPVQGIHLATSPVTAPETQNPLAKPKKNKWFLIIVLIIVLLVGAISAYFLIVKKSSDGQSEIVIGFNADQSTPGTGPAGTSALHGFQIAVDEINAKGGLLGKKIKITNLNYH